MRINLVAVFALLIHSQIKWHARNVEELRVEQLQQPALILCRWVRSLFFSLIFFFCCPFYMLIVSVCVLCRVCTFERTRKIFYSCLVGHCPHLSQLLANFIFPRRQFKFYCVHATICINTYACKHHIDVGSSDMPFNEYTKHTQTSHTSMFITMNRLDADLCMCAFVLLFILIL